MNRHVRLWNVATHDRRHVMLHLPMANCLPDFQAGRSGLPPLLCELLKRPPALAALPLLQALRAIYEHHPRPKVGSTPDQSPVEQVLLPSCGPLPGDAAAAYGSLRLC